MEDMSITEEERNEVNIQMGKVCAVSQALNTITADELEDPESFYSNLGGVLDTACAEICKVLNEVESRYLKERKPAA
jgi:hypothetical protein